MDHWIVTLRGRVSKFSSQDINTLTFPDSHMTDPSKDRKARLAMLPPQTSYWSGEDVIQDVESQYTILVSQRITEIEFALATLLDGCCNSLEAQHPLSLPTILNLLRWKMDGDDKIPIVAFFTHIQSLLA